MNLEGMSRKELMELVIELAGSLKEEDLHDPETYSLIGQLMDILDDSGYSLPKELITQLSQIQDKKELFRQAVQAIGVSDEAQLQQIARSLEKAGLLKSEDFTNDLFKAAPIDLTNSHILMFPVKIKGQHKSEDPNIPDYHVTLKWLGVNKAVDHSKVSELVSKHQLNPPKITKIEPLTWNSPRGDIHVLALHGDHDNLHSAHEELSADNKSLHPYTPHITVSKELHDRVKNEGLTPEQLGIEVGPLAYHVGGQKIKEFHLAPEADTGFVKPLKKGQNGDWKKEGYKISGEWKREGDRYEANAHDKDGNHVGYASFDLSSSGKTLWPHNVGVDDGHKRKGVASAMYAHAEKETNSKMDIDGSRPQSSEAYNMWRQENRPFGSIDSKINLRNSHKKIKLGKSELVNKAKSILNKIESQLHPIHSNLQSKNHYRSALKHADQIEDMAKSDKLSRASQNAMEYCKTKGFDYKPDLPLHKVDPTRGKLIADEYHKMKHNPNHPAVKQAYDAMIDETLEQYKFLKSKGLKISRIEQGQDNPYKNGSNELRKDINDNHHIAFFPTDQGFGAEADQNFGDNPLLRKTGEMHNGKELLANDVFRIVHDYFGHHKDGHTFGPHGEDNAWKSHAQMYSPLARKALTVETRGQNSWVNYGPHGETNRKDPANTQYAEQKTGLLPDWCMDHDDLKKSEKKSVDELMAEIKNQSEARESTINNIKAGGERTLKFKHPTNPERHVIVSPSTQKKGMWRATHFDSIGPSGHSEAHNFEDALDLVRQYGASLDHMDEDMDKSLNKGQNGDWKKEGYKISHKTSGNSIKVSAHDKGGELVGSVHVYPHEDESHLVANHLSVNESHQRKGIATAMYGHASKTMGKPFHPDVGDGNVRTGQGQKFRNSLKKTQQTLFPEDAIHAAKPRKDQWFGQSKIKNSDGSPKVMYHGTDHDVKEFEVGRPTTRGLMLSSIPVKTQGNFFGHSEEQSAKYGRKVLPVHIKMENPLLHPDIDAPHGHGIGVDKLHPEKEKHIADMLLAGAEKGENGNKIIRGLMNDTHVTPAQQKLVPDHDEDEVDHSWIYNHIKHGGLDWEVLDNPKIVHRMIQLGYDGTYVHEPHDEEGSSLFVPHTHQIKHVEAEKFDPSDKNIYKSDLTKGAMKRIYPVPRTPKKPAKLGEWQDGGGDRDSSPYESDPNVRNRMLHKLSTTTKTRIKNDGKREFLLHRGEDSSHPSKHRGEISHDVRTSWTPHFHVAASHATDQAEFNEAVYPDKKSAVHSAWVHEDKIASIPLHYGNLDEDSDKKGENSFRSEHEVIVEPYHESELHDDIDVDSKTKWRELKSRDQSLEERISPRGNVDKRINQRAFKKNDSLDKTLTKIKSIIKKHKV